MFEYETRTTSSRECSGRRQLKLPNISTWDAPFYTTSPTTQTSLICNPFCKHFSHGNISAAAFTCICLPCGTMTIAWKLSVKLLRVIRTQKHFLGFSESILQQPMGFFQMQSWPIAIMQCKLRFQLFRRSICGACGTQCAPSRKIYKALFRHHGQNFRVSFGIVNELAQLNNLTRCGRICFHRWHSNHENISRTILLAISRNGPIMFAFLYPHAECNQPKV